MWSLYVFWIDNGDPIIPLEVVGVEGDEMRDVVYFHRSNEASVVNASTDHPMLFDEPFPFEKYLGIISQKSEYSLEHGDVLGSLVNRKGKTIVNCRASSDSPEFNQILGNN